MQEFGAMNKICSLCTVLALTVSTSSAFAKDTLVVWEDEGRSSYISYGVRAFESAFDCNVVVEEIDMYDQTDKLLKLGPKDKGPDIVVLASDMVGNAKEKDALAPIDYMQLDATQYLPNALNAVTFDGRCYGVPKTIEALVVFYNKALLSKPLSTLEEYNDLSVKMQKDDKYGLIAKWDSFYTTFGLMKSYGSYLFKSDLDGNTDLTDIGIDNDESVAALTYIRDMAKKGLISKELTGDQGYKVMSKLFRTGKAAAIINGPWAVDSYLAAGIDLGIAPLPVLPNGERMTSFLGTKAYAISKWSKHHELAESFLEFINQPSYALSSYLLGKQVPPQVKVLENPILDNDELIQVMALQSANAVNLPTMPEMHYVWPIMDNAIGEVINSNKDIRKTLKTAKLKILDKVKHHYEEDD